MNNTVQRYVVQHGELKPLSSGETLPSDDAAVVLVQEQDLLDTRQVLADNLGWLNTATDLINMMLLVHAHEPIFTPEQEDAAQTFAQEAYKRQRLAEGLTSLPTVEQRQASEIKALRQQVEDLTSENTMLRSYEAETLRLVKCAEEQAEQAHQQLLAVVTLMRGQGLMAQDIERFVNASKARMDASYSESVACDGEYKTLTFQAPAKQQTTPGSRS